ncbi:MAG: biotin attachment protein [Sphaerochaetaceae bacterium]|nr:biotin attachment protein [Sphaerochaetaceae bacterium]
MAKKPIKFMCTAFRDGFQSVYGARVITKDFIDAVSAAREAGIDHFEAGGGARFQALYFYTNENAFDMMDAFRKAAGSDANLQTLSRGVNVVGLDSQPRDIIDLHAKMFKKHGMTTIRNFDALNDVNNLIDSANAIKNAGLKHETTITMMSLPPNAKGAHDPQFYEMVLRNILDAKIPFDSICYKDASGTSTPQYVYETIKRAREILPKDMDIVMHSHETAGCCVQQYMRAIEAGATQVDLSMEPVSGGTCQVDIVTMWHALRNTDYVLVNDRGEEIDINKIQKAESVFKACMADYFLPPEATSVNPMIPFFPLPGGALTANTQMLRDNGLMDKYPLIVEAMEETVAKGGYGTSVTPVSQFYFQQAFNNVMYGKWKKIAEGYGKMVLGYFGKTPVAPDAEVIKIASEQLKLEPTTEKCIDINDKDPKKGVEAAKAMLEKASLPITDENIFIAASCKEKGILFLQGKAKINGVRKNSDAPKAEAPKTEAANSKTTIKSPIGGKIVKLNIAKGSSISSGDNIAIISDNGKEYAIFAPRGGKVSDVKVALGESVNSMAAVAIVE